MATQTGDSIQVIVRVRPWNEKEKAAGTVPVVHTDNQAKTVSVVRRSEKSSVTKQTKFSGFRAVLTGFTSQKEVFDSSVEPLVHEVLQGYSATAFAYGQTGTGKTWTMEGDVKDEENFGIIPRSAHLIFDTLGDLDRFETSRVSVSYLEIYNEELFDLLIEPDKKDVPKLRVVEDTSSESRGVYCMGLSEVTVESASEVVEILQKADEKRRVEETKMNKTSSRSHCLFTICVTAREILPGGGRVMERTGRLHLVDLAGSESAKTAGGNQDRGRERKNINQSLLALGRVITALQSITKEGATDLAGRVPYRESKLTRLLQEALGGKSKTCIVATCSPSELAVEETVSTLGYAQRACGIKNRPTQNQLMSGMGGGLSRTSGGFGAGSTQDWADMELRLSYMETQVREAQLELARQHELQKEATARAEAAEEVVAGLEEEVEEQKQEVSKQQDRVGLLHNRLAKRHVHVTELRHLMGCRRTTEEELTEQANQLIITLRESIGTSEQLQKCNEEVARDAEERRLQGINYVSTTTESLGSMRDQCESHLLSESAALKLLDEASMLSTTASQQFGEDLTQSITALEEDVTSKAEELARKVDTVVTEAAEEETKTLANASKEMEVACELVVEKASDVNNALSSVLSDVSNSEASLVSWAESTSTQAANTGQSLSQRADTNTATAQASAIAMDARHESSLARIAKDVEAMDTLLNDLSEHSALAQVQATSAAEAEQIGARSLLGAQGSLEEAAASLVDMVKAQREGQADETTLKQIAEVATLIAETSKRQAAALKNTNEQVQVAQETILKLVEEQKQTQQQLVRTVIEQVTKTLEEQTSILFSKLDAAAASVSNHHSEISSKHAALGEDMASTFDSLSQSCDVTKETVEGWGESDNRASQSVDTSVSVMNVAIEKARADSLIIAEMHQKASEESVDLERRTQAEILAVSSLKDSAVVAAEVGEESRVETTAAMDEQLKIIDTWKKADGEYTASTLGSIEVMLKDVRSDFMERINKEIVKTQLLTTETLVTTLKDKLSENQNMLGEDSRSRREKGSQFASLTSESLVGEEQSVIQTMKMNSESLRQSLRIALEAEEAARVKNRAGMTSHGEVLTAFDFDLKEWSINNEAKLQSFGLEVLRMNDPVEMPSPLTEVEVVDNLASTKPHETLLSELHNDSGESDTLEACMLKRVEHLLQLHTQAMDSGQVPFHDPTEFETAETPIDPLAFVMPPPPPKAGAMSLDDTTELDEEDLDDINPLLGQKI